MPGVARNDDPALDIAHEHDHHHLHHSPHAAHPDNVIYTAGTTDEKSSKFLNSSDQDSHAIQHHPVKEKHDLEKGAGYDFAVEKASHGSSDPEVAVKMKPFYALSPSEFYRRFRLPIHIFIGAFFTG
jgi:CNT family concentrative nucleoside transporter